MSESPNQHIARIKLNEVQRQRGQLNEHYAAIEAKTHAGTSPLERLRILYDGLRQARFAQKPLHPDVANLDLLLLEAATGTPSAALVDDWVRQLEREVQRGRLRAEFAHAFGQTLSEWANAPVAAADTAGTRGLTDEPWRILLEPPTAGVDPSFLRGLFRNNEPPLRQLRDNLYGYGQHEALNPVSREEVKALLAYQSGDDFRQPQLRRQALTASRSETVVDELADTLTILLNNLDDWDWPTEGVRPVALWKNLKWRPYLQEDLVPLLFLQLIGLRWGMRIKSQSYQCLTNIYGQEQLFFPDDYYARSQAEQHLFMQRLNRASGLFLTMIPTNLQEWGGGGYGGGGSGYGRRQGKPDLPSSLENLLIAVHAEICFHQHAHPNTPLHVVQADLRDFYLSIPHDIVMILLEQLNVPKRWQAFFRKYLALAVRHDGGKQPVRRGLVLGHLIGAVLADCLMLMLDIHIFKRSGLRDFRVVDDIFLFGDNAESVSAAWRAVGQFCTACGLTINESKSGSVCLGGPAASAELPAGLPRWGMLRLHPDGMWRVDEPTFNLAQEETRRQVENAPTVLGKIARYNENVNFLHKNLGLCAPMPPHGADHLRHVGQYLSRLHQQLFGPGHGMVEELRRSLEKLFLDARLQQAGLPESLLYWPVTAGGLGLTHPLVAVTGFQKGLEKSPRQSPPSATANPWPGGNNYHLWFTYYMDLTRANSLTAPDATPAMERLVQDFIARGSEVGGRKQKGLSAYWQWIVYTYGPALLDALGTFRFLLTELVPLQLILENRLDLSSLSEAGGGEPAGSETAV